MRSSPREMHNLYRSSGIQTYPQEEQNGGYQTFQGQHDDQALAQEVQSGGSQNIYGHQESQTQALQIEGHQNLHGHQSVS